MLSENYFPLGKSGIKISKIGIGTMLWKDKVNSDADSNNGLDSISDVFSTAVNCGVNFFDTAEIYGIGKSEVLLGKCVDTSALNVVIATKFMPFPWRLSRTELRRALIRSIRRLGVDSIDLYQVHWPFPPLPIRIWMNAMADVVDEGLIRAVGVSNYSTLQTELAYSVLEKRGIYLASNQIKYSLLDRRPEKTGLVDLCKKLGITIIAYSPLEKGILTGKYSPEKIPQDFRAWRYNKRYLKKIEPLLTELRVIGSRYGGKTPGQVSLNWLIAKGIVPIPGTNTITQAQENSDVMNWTINSGDVARLDNISNSFIS